MAEVETQDSRDVNQLRWLTDVYMQVQKLRVANGNRVGASERGDDEHGPDPFVASLVDKLEDIEGDIFRQMKRSVKDHPAHEWLDGIKGMGPTLSTKVLGLIGDIESFTTVSRLWAFSGYGLRDGKRQFPVKGEKLSYNKRLKTALYLCGDSFIKSRSPYRDIYDVAKEKYRREKQLGPISEILGLSPAELPDRLTPRGKQEWDKIIRTANRERGVTKGDGECWSDGHVDNAARRKMVKIFLSHLYEVWREAEGFEVRRPYVHEYMKHSTYSSPWDFSKAEKPSR